MLFVVPCWFTCLLGLLCTFSPVQAQQTASAATRTAPAPIRFLLTFDDGPSASDFDNPSEKILNALDKNPYQSDIKAIFFTQTQAKGAGGSEHGRALLKRMFETGHELAFHTATAGHANHRFLSEETLRTSLVTGVQDLSAVRGSPPQLVRPPFWSYNERTLAMYHEHGMQMLLTDLSANDGVIYVFNFSFSKRKNMRQMLLSLKPSWEAGELPSVDGATPIVVTFHDINRYTANHIEEYLGILLDVAKELEMPTTTLPFYDKREEMLRAAMLKTTKTTHAKQELPGIWNWFWSWF
ncbi:polysaccharide deacetylase family protein [Undibacterium sp. LX40W]|uniref:Polysaccharide deacetylase family protein n=1 Tax=Undibacterium nitidum TaxID=2762298 RepID=A0A923KNP6_9BURK|nr:MULTISPECIES: polysaccharide deacetylase family protein [Undibacterium]MBC3880908.1 polysaccharide deacetylase family protein [Undibacterium nitidum]MBC3890359.1 polysaccharide deacetylase family protein [Undibacterium sp. LX40W]